jgi:aminoglycoside phosphotransferase (APT) family kinase protein
LHRDFWGAAELEQRFWLLPKEIDARLRHSVSRPGFRHLADEPHEAVAACGRWLDAHYAALMRALAAQAPRTLVHGDLRLDNVCYDHGGDACTFLDWQLTRAGPAAYDVAYFLGGALGSDVGAGEEDAILRDYHQALGRDDYPFERLQRDYQRGLVLSLAAVAPTADIVIDAGRGQQMMAVWRERLAARLRRVDLAALL